MNITANGDTDIETLPGREYAFAATGTFGSGTLTAKYSIDGTNFATFNDGSADVALTAAGARVLVSPGRKIRLTLASATSPAIVATLAPIV